MDEELSQQIYGFSNHLILDFNKLYVYDVDYANVLLKEPKTHLRELEEYITKKAERNVELHLVNLPISTNIHDLKDSEMKTLIQLEGTIIQRGIPLMRVTKLHFKCRTCGMTEETVVQDQQYRKYPSDPCTYCKGNKWVHDYSKSEFTNYQEIYIQELIENTPNGSSPDKVKAVLTGSLIRSCEPGENVMVVGILEAYDQSSRSANIELEYHINVVSLINNTDADTINLTKEDIDNIQQLMKQPEHLDNIINSIAPTIYGLEYVKEALALQQCEGQVKTINQTRRRGQFHILLAGPPGLGKSILGDFMVKCNPKGRKAVGRGASGVGLTASVVKDDEHFVLRAGAMALADNGFLFVDEIEKMNQTDSGAMHPGMEQQEIIINKADISATLKTRCSVLAACNPLGGVWDDYKTIIGNLYDKGRGLSLPLLDRFALIFIIKQNTSREDEENVINHIITTSEDVDLSPPYNVDLLRRIFAYARTIDVRITKEVGRRIKNFYMLLYEAAKRDNVIIVSRRQIQDLIRLSEASARLHGRNETTLEDAECAIRIVAKSLQEYGIDPQTGKVDQSKALYSEVKTQRIMIRELPQILVRLCQHNIDKTKINRVELVEHASKLWMVSLSEVGDVLNVLLKDGIIYCPTPYTLALSSPQSLNMSLDIVGDEED